MNYRELSEMNNKYLTETRCLENPKYIEYLMQTRNVFQSLFLSLGSNENVGFVTGIEEIKFLKEYKEFIKITNSLFPKFIFDDFEAEIFDKCVQFKEAGHSFVETEEYYIKVLQKGKTF